jgi:hypothetical protein
MIKCQKCGTENPLGRVFCMRCGNKLELTALSSEVVQEKLKLSFWQKHKNKFFTTILLILIILIALILWPNTEVVGEKGVPLGRQRVEEVLKALAQTPPGQSGMATFSEKDLNTYFELALVPKAKLESFSIFIKEGFFFVRMVKPIFSISFLKIKIAPLLSFEMYCVPIKDNQVLIRQAKVGHFPLKGATQKIAARAIEKQLAEDSAWALHRYIAQIKAEPGQLTIVVKK